MANYTNMKESYIPSIQDIKTDLLAIRDQLTSITHTCKTKLIVPYSCKEL